jgi:hypothetical protein
MKAPLFAVDTSDLETAQLMGECDKRVSQRLQTRSRILPHLRTS